MRRALLLIVLLTPLAASATADAAYWQFNWKAAGILGSPQLEIGTLAGAKDGYDPGTDNLYPG